MARAVVVGGGYGGLAAAARLGKLGHEVTLLEAGDTLGGALSPVTADGFTWDGGPTHTLVPAVVRDLFRKSGRSLEAELRVPAGAELTPISVLREHRFVDGTSVRLPAGSRRAQREAFEGLEPGLGVVWDAHVARYAEVWDQLRRHYFEEPWQPDSLPREVAAILESRENLRRRLRRMFRDDRLVDVAGHPFLADGHELRDVPAWAGLTAYLEQLFGAWTLPGGMHRLRDLLVARLEQRGVSVRLGHPVSDVVVREGRAVAVAGPDGELAAEVVVCAVDPRRLPVLAPYVARTQPALPPVIAHIGLDDVAGLDGLDLPAHEVVLHGPATVTVRPGGTAPHGGAAWTLHGRGKLSEDPLVVLARLGLDVRSHVVTRVDRSPREAVLAWGGSPLGVRWQGRGTVRARLGPTTPVAGVYAVGAHATPGSGLAFVGLGAALVAQAVGPA